MKVSGIYKITNTVNGKVYVGSAVNVQRRWFEHKNHLQNQKHHSQHLQRAWNSYGESVFAFELIESVNKEDLIQREQHWMDLLRAFGKHGYNVSPKAGSSLGIKRSDETRRRISQSKHGSIPWNTGQKTGPQSPELVKRRIAPLVGTSRPDEVKKAISETKRARGQKVSAQAMANSAAKRKRNAELRKMGLLPPLYDEERRKQVGAAISAAKQAAKAARLSAQLLNK